MCELAAIGGHLDVLKYVREHGCPLTARTCELAAAGGHLEVLRWARQLDCPWDPLTCRRAARENQDMLALIQQLGGDA